MNLRNVLDPVICFHILHSELITTYSDSLNPTLNYRWSFGVEHWSIEKRSGHGSGIYYWNEESLFPWGPPQASSWEQFTPIRLCGSYSEQGLTGHHIRIFSTSPAGTKAFANPRWSSQTVKDYKQNINQLGPNNKIMLSKSGFTNLILIMYINLHCKVMNCNRTPLDMHVKHRNNIRISSDPPLSSTRLPQIYISDIRGSTD